MSSGAGFCHKCGTQLPPEATFCPKCGAAVMTSSVAQPTVQQPMPRHGEKAEKREKQEKGEKYEKSSGGGMLGALVGGFILIWLGITFFLEENGNLPSDTWWAYFIGGIGVILVIQGVAIYARGRNGVGSIIGGAILAFIGLSTIAANQFSISARLWPLLIVALGIFVLFAGLASRRRVPTP